MKLYAEAKLQIVSKENFPDEQGQTIEFYKNYLKTDDGEVFIVNSKRDFGPSEGKHGVATVNVRETKDNSGRNITKLSLVAFREGEEIPVEKVTESIH